MSRRNLLRRKARNFLAQPGFTLAWFIPCWLLLGLAKGVIFAVPFRRLAPLMGSGVGLASRVPVLTVAREARARQIRHAVQLAARYTPWNCNCFPQAVVARILLGLYGIPYALFLGVRNDARTGAFDAHAWVAAGRVNVVGGSSFGKFTVVGCFVARQLANA